VTVNEVPAYYDTNMGELLMLKSNGSERLPTTPPFSGSGNTRRISVLYVDESPALANLICMYLDRNGEMMVDTSQSVEDAMNKLRYIAYDVVVTDYNNKERDGNQLLRNVRAKGEVIPFVYFVVSRMNEFEIEAKQLGQVSFIEKMGPSGANFGQLRQAILKAALEYRINTAVRAEPSAERTDVSAKS
jgi:DNA-binding NtrC family response regulator